MMPRFSGLLLLIITAASVRAQAPEAFYPLHEGDTWTYERERWQSSSFETFLGYRRVTILADTLIGGEPYAVAGVEYLRFTQEVDSTARCAVRVSGAETRVEWVPLRGTCGALEVGRSLTSEVPSTATYYVGGQAYTGPTLSADNFYFMAAAGVGAVTTHRISFSQHDEAQHLLVADVAGTHTGTMPSPSAWRAFLPLSVGDYWIYTTDSYSYPFTRIFHDAYEVVGDSVVDNTLYARVETRRYQQDPSTGAISFERASVQLWRLREDLGCIVERFETGYERCRTGTEHARLQARVQPADLVIGGQTRRVGRIRLTYYVPISADGALDVVEGLGLTRYHTFRAGPHNGARTDITLLYALVDGVSYGARPTWTEGGPPSLIGVVPSFVDRGTTITLRVSGQSTAFEAGRSAATVSGEGIEVLSTAVVNATTADVRVRIAYDAPLGPRGVDMTTYGETLSFPFAVTVAARTLATPAPLTPRDGAIATSQTTFTWRGVSQATAYTFQLARDSTFADLVAAQIVTAPTATADISSETMTMYWRVIATSPGEVSAPSAARLLQPPPPTDHTFFAVRPNPVRNAATLPFSLAYPTHVTVRVYNAIGQEVAVLVDQNYAAGRYEVRIPNGQLPAGTYFVRADMGGTPTTQTFTVLR